MDKIGSIEHERVIIVIDQKMLEKVDALKRHWGLRSRSAIINTLLTEIFTDQEEAETKNAAKVPNH